MLDCVQLFIQHTGRYDLVADKIGDSLSNNSELMTNGALSGTYAAGLAPNWTKTGTGLTPSEETSDVPTSGVSSTQAQKLTFVTGSGATGLLLSSALSLTRGKWYRISFYYKVITGSITSVSIVDPTFSDAVIPTITISSSLTATSWTQITYDFESPVTTSTMKLAFNVGGTTNNTAIVDVVSLKELSGGPDARWYINQAIDFLDQQQQTPKSEAWYISTPASGTSYISLLNCRTVKEVWAKAEGEARTLLTKLSLRNMRELYPDNAADTDVGEPLYWAVGSPRQAPSQKGNALNTEDGLDLIQYSPGLYTQLQFMPPTDGTYTIRILGEFYSSPLTYDNYSNWWTENKPWVVVWTAKYILEGALRSAEGMKDLNAFLQPYFMGIEKDLVSDEITDVIEMEG